MHLDCPAFEHRPLKLPRYNARPPNQPADESDLAADFQSELPLLSFHAQRHLDGVAYPLPIFQVAIL